MEIYIGIAIFASLVMLNRRKSKKNIALFFKYYKECEWDKALEYLYKGKLLFGVVIVTDIEMDNYIKLLFETNSNKLIINIKDRLKNNTLVHYKFYIYGLLNCAIKGERDLFMALTERLFKIKEKFNMREGDDNYNLIKGIECYFKGDKENAKCFLGKDMIFNEPSVDCIYRIFKYKMHIEDNDHVKADKAKERLNYYESVYKKFLKEEA